jgi:ABC-2 type transport system permease protein
VLAGFLGYLPQLLAGRSSGTRAIVVLDGTSGNFGARVDSAFSAQRVVVGGDTLPRYAVTRLAADDHLLQLRDSVVATIGRREHAVGTPVGVLVLTDSAIETGRLTYLGSDVTGFQNVRSLERTLEPVVRDERLSRRNADSALKAAASVRLNLQTTKVTEGKVTGESGETSFLLAYIVDMFMYISLLLYGVQVMSSVIEEKSTRIVEVLVSSLTPFQLLMGKVVGVGAVGLLQLGIWAGTGLYITRSLARPSVDLSAAGDAAQAGFSMPNVTPDLILVILLFFLLGFFLYAGLYAAVGSMCSTQQEAQQSATPVTMIVVVGMIFMFSLINEPSSTLARVVTFIPFFTPLVIPVRYAISPLSVGEVALGALEMVLSIMAVVWLAGRIYRVGILSYGKKPSLKELLQWVRTA